MQGSSEGKYKLSALKISAIAIFSVVIVEVTIGSMVNSLAIISDGLHALLDALTSLMLFFAVRASLKPPDEEHTYGHEKFETIGGLLGGVVLIGVALLIFDEAINRLISGSHLNANVEYAGFIAVGYAMLIAILRITVFRKAQHDSQSMKVGFYDAVADLSSTLIALLGFVLTLLGFTIGDAAASIFLGAMLTYLSLKLVRASISELSDTASKDLVAKIGKLILGCAGVQRIESLKVRKVGSKIFVDTAVQVSSSLSLEDAHTLSSRVESCLKDALGNVDATIHVEPSEQDKNLVESIKKLAAVEGVREVHEIIANRVGGKLYVSLHAYVNPELSVEEAHKIAETIERKIRAEIKPLENVTVHVEPAVVTIHAEQFDEAKLQKVVAEVAASVDGNLEVKRVVTYAADGKRYINIDCCFTNNVQIKEAHRMASLIEKETKMHFANAVVTVHIEPQC